MILAGVCALSVHGKEPAPVQAQFSTIYEPCFTLEDVYVGQGRQYVPQAGDIAFATNNKSIQSIGHVMAGAHHPHHSMIVFIRPDGRPAVLEAGPHDSFRLQIRDVENHLAGYEQGGRCWIRRRKTPLTEEQSCALTRWCLAQDKKLFAEHAIIGLALHIGARGPLRTAVMGRARLDKLSYYCVETAATALVAAGLMDAEKARPGAMFPRDLFFGQTNNRWVNAGLAGINENWYPPARWTNLRPPDICEGGGVPNALGPTPEPMISVSPR